jgi:hypothetical protein
MSFSQSVHLNEEDSFAYDDNPFNFVRINKTDVVFTVEGIRYFKPRFQAVGIDIADINSAEDFHSARRAWNLLEAQMVVDLMTVKAEASRSPSEHKVLAAVLDQGAQAAQFEAARLQRMQHVNLFVVRKCVSDAE